MLVSMIGSHGTGKTTLINHLRKQPGIADWPVFNDYFRNTSKRLGYNRPRDILLEAIPHKHIASTAMTSAALGALQQWLDGSEPQNGFIDFGPPALLAYHRYWMTVCKMPVSTYLLHFCRKVSDQVDYFIYLPSNHFPIKKDAMRSADPIFQKDVDQWVKSCIKELEIPESKLLFVSSHSEEGRVTEVLEWLENKALTPNQHEG